MILKIGRTKREAIGEEEHCPGSGSVGKLREFCGGRKLRYSSLVNTPFELFLKYGQYGGSLPEKAISSVSFVFLRFFFECPLGTGV